VPGTDLAACLLASDLATHLVPGTDLAAYLLASDLFPHLVPGTDLADCLLASTGSGRRPKLRWICTAPGAWHRFGRLFASIRPGAAPGAWHRFGRLFASIDRLGSETQATVDLLPTWCLAPIWRPVPPFQGKRLLLRTKPRAALRFALGYPLVPRWGIKPSGVVPGA